MTTPNHNFTRPWTRAPRHRIGRWSLVLSLCACGHVPGATVASANAPGDETDSAAGAWVRAMRPTPDKGGIGSLQARGPDIDGSVHLSLTRLDVRVRPAGHLAAFEVEHRFHNDSDEDLEGTFRFTLPPGAVVTGLAMNIGEEMMEGEFVDRDKARQTFEKIVDSMRDPALLEWEQGKAFKLRVFPIEANADKRVVLRYFAPLGDAVDGSPEITVPLAAADLQRGIADVVVHVEGGTGVQLSDVDSDRILYVPVPSTWRRDDVLTERAEGSRFTAARVAPRWDELPATVPGPNARRVVLVVDSSRSALEAWPRVRETVAAVLASLDTDDRVALLTTDVTTVDRGDGFAAPSSARAAGFDMALEDLGPDGASDLAAALDAVASLVENADPKRRTQIVYLGDGAPTWGQLDTGELAAKVDAMPADVELHAIALGKRADPDTLRALAGRRRGTVVQPSQARQLAAAADFLAHTHQIRSLEDVEVTVDGDPDAEVVLPPGGTWFEGESPIAYIRAEAGAPPARAITIQGRIGDQSVVQRIALDTAAADSRGLSRLWASREIDAIAAGHEDAAMKKEQIIMLSQDYGVLSRHTSLLVLESEEAYERYQIERRQAARQAAAAAAGDPTVSGADLESVGLSPGDLQPGDPEIHIPAPRDALAVAVVFPFGETKLARWDADAEDWTVRFLVADDTPAGTYAVRVRITHADGRVELGTATYTIDMTAPAVDVRVVPDAMNPARMRVIVTQRLTEADAARERLEGRSDGDEQAHSLDLGRVRALMPDGQTLILRRMEAGRFERAWTPRTGWRAIEEVAIELTVTDRALNSRASTVALDPVALAADLAALEE